MNKLIQSVKDFKIIPNNFKSAGEFELLEVSEDKIKVRLILLDESELQDYKPGGSVEVFGVNSVGLIYFETKILDIDKDIAHLALTNDYSIIQRREYSRVNLENGSIIFNDLSEDFVTSVEDIFAGGVKFIAKSALETDKTYSILIKLTNNMKIECKLKPIRINEIEHEGKKEFVTSGKFVDLENMDRIVLVQYAFKVKMEEQNKNNDTI